MSSRAATDYVQHAEAHGPSVPELFGRLATESSQLIRDEIALAKREIHEKGLILRAGFLWAAVASFLGLAALLALCGAAAAALTPVIGGWQALLVVGGGLLVISGAIAGVSVGILRRLTVKPEHPLHRLEEN